VARIDVMASKIDAQIHPAGTPWTADEVRQNLEAFLEAAAVNTQEVLVAAQRFRVSATRVGKIDARELLRRGGPLDDDD